MLGLKKWYFISCVKESPQIIVPKYFNILRRKAFVHFMFFWRIKFKTSPFFSKEIFPWATFNIFLFKYESLYSCLLHLFIVHFFKQIFYIVSIIFRTFLLSFAKNKYDINQDYIVYILKSRGFSFRDFIFPI